VLFEKNIAHHLSETPDLKWWLQGFGDNIEILEPTELRDKFKRVAVNLASIYSDPWHHLKNHIILYVR